MNLETHRACLAEAKKLRHTARLRDYPRQMQFAAAHRLSEVFPQDMAIWRAILVGEERFAFLYPQEKLLRAARRAFLQSKTLFEIQARTSSSAGLAPRHHLEKMHRFVLFTHPFTGGRAVFSEPVD